MLSALALALLAQTAAPPGPPLPPDDKCRVPPARLPLAFAPGETLDYDLDALGAQAGKLTLRVLPEKGGALPLEAHAITNTFFSKVRRVNGVAVSYASPKTLRPAHYTEDAIENEVHKTIDVTFAKDRRIRLQFTVGDRAGSNQFKGTSETLDALSAVYTLRQLPLKAGQEVCFDAYGVRTLWRVSGKTTREHVSLPLGEFEAWHLAGEAVKLDDHTKRREVHVWLSDDARRLPLAALGTIDLGAVRATLTAFARPGEKKARAESKANMKW